MNKGDIIGFTLHSKGRRDNGKCFFSGKIPTVTFAKITIVAYWRVKELKKDLTN